MLGRSARLLGRGSGLMARYQMPVAGGAAQDAATGLALGDRDQQKRQLHVTRPREVTTLALGAIGVGAGALGLRYVVEGRRRRRRAVACVLLVGGRWAVARKRCSAVWTRNGCS